MKLVIFLCLSVVSATIQADLINCGICFDVGTDALVAVTECGHCYHRSCLTQWYNIRKICPMCVGRLPSGSNISHTPRVYPLGTLPRACAQPNIISVVLGIGYQLVVAAKTGDVNVVEQLLVGASPADLSFSVPGDRPVLNAQYQLTVGTSPMIEACRGGHVHIVEKLITAYPDIDLRVADSDGDTAISLATEYAHADILALLNIDPQSNYAGNLMAACRRDDIGAIPVLLAMGPDRCSHAERARALWYSATEGKNEIVSMLLSQGFTNYRDKSNLSTPLIQASRNGHFAIVQMLFTANPPADLELKDREGNTALLLAAQFGHDEIVQLVVSQGAHLDNFNNDGNTALIQACRHGHSEIVKMLITANPPADLDLMDREGNTALMLAASHRNDVIVKLLVSQGANLDKVNNNGNTALIQACRHGHFAIVKMLITANPPAHLDLKDREGNTALISAAQFGHDEIVQLLVSQGASLDEVNNNGNTALIQACRHGHSEIVQKLMTAYLPADLELKDREGNTALILAAQFGHDVIVQLILSQGADRDNVDNDGNTALIQACRHGHSEIVEKLITANLPANLELKNRKGNTALIFAARYGHDGIVELLVSQGANLDTVNNDGNTALIQACNKGKTAEGKTAVVEILVNAGANLDKFNSDEETALIQACRHGHSEIVKILLRAGASIYLKNKRGDDAMQIAHKHGKYDIYRQLQDLDDRINMQKSRINMQKGIAILVFVLAFFYLAII